MTFFWMPPLARMTLCWLCMTFFWMPPPIRGCVGHSLQTVWSRNLRPYSGPLQFSKILANPAVRRRSLPSCLLPRSSSSSLVSRVTPMYRIALIDITSCPLKSIVTVSTSFVLDIRTAAVWWRARLTPGWSIHSLTFAITALQETSASSMVMVTTTTATSSMKSTIFIRSGELESEHPVVQGVP